MASTPAQLQAAFNITTWDVAGRNPLYETGDTVYIRSEYDTAGQATFTQKAYTIVNNWVSPTDGAGNLLDANGATAVGSTAADISTIGAGNDTAAEWPTFYEIQETANVSNKFVIHESKILSLAGVNAIRDANNWT